MGQSVDVRESWVIGQGGSKAPPTYRYTADLIPIAARSPSQTIRAACDRVRILPNPTAATTRLQGDVVIVEAGALDEPTQLLITEIRRNSAARVVILASALSADQRILALTHGADHVLDAAIDERELAAILRNAVRPHPLSLASPRANEEEHRWTLEADRWVLMTPNDREVRLTHSEYAVLDLLIGQAGIVQPRSALRAAVDGDASRERVLDVLISRLRRKVWDVAGMELPLRSARSAGYVFAGGTGSAASVSPPLISRAKSATPR